MLDEHKKSKKHKQPPPPPHHQQQQQSQKLNDKIKKNKSFEDLENELLFRIAKAITNCFLIYRERSLRNKKSVSHEEWIKLTRISDNLLLKVQCFIFIFF